MKDKDKRLEEKISEDFSIQSLVDYLLENSRGFTEEDVKIYNEGLEKISKQTGRNLFYID